MPASVDAPVGRQNGPTIHGAVVTDRDTSLAGADVQ